MNTTVITAVFKRNLFGYFSSPIGYVFICVFVLLSGFAAFWPNEFFNNNLATLDQLNTHLPWIMLVFIPAITMGLWAEERRHGTDELLLTLPGSDLDVVIGKYLAALSIYTVALIFSLSNIIVLRGLGQPDLGLLLGNYVGYWLVGGAMLSIGMVASFLTTSLTVAFILGLIFNAPLVFAEYLGSWEIGGAQTEGAMYSVQNFLRSTSIGEQFRDFGRGLITLSGVVFFLSIVIVNLYLSMVLIGRRHWASGRTGHAMGLHFAARVLSLIALVIGVNVAFSRFDWRIDASKEKVNSVSAQTIAMLNSLDTAGERPVYVEAYVSPTVPEEYVQTRLNMLAMLREADAIAGDKVVVRIHNTERFSAAEAQAEQQFGIRPMPVQSTSGGKIAVDQIVMGAAFTCGLDKVVVPFFDRGISAEYEIIRSIATVSQQSRKKIAVLTTDAKLFGGFDIETMSNRPSQQLIEELQKQYEVVQVNADSPITETYDALLAVQPSSLSPTQMENFLAAVRNGQPTAIFEDPFPALDPSVPATSQPRTPPRRNPFMQQPPPQPKGDVTGLWNLLGAQIDATQIVWQDYNPYPKVANFSEVREYVFIGKGSGAAEPFSESNPATAGLQQIVALFPGYISPLPGATTQLRPLVQTGRQTGYVVYDDIIQRNFLGPTGLNPRRRQIQTNQTYTLAAHITGTPAPAATPQATKNLNVILVSDIDMLYSVFFALRARGADPNDPVSFNLDNVSFVLNTLDDLAGDDRFIEIRKRRPVYRTLRAVEDRIDIAKAHANAEREKFVLQFETKRNEEQKRLDDKLAELKERKDIDPRHLLDEVATAQQAGQNRLNAKVAELEKERDAQIATIERRLALQVRRIQDKYKLAAVAFPAIPPLLVGAVVFVRRRSMAKIGVPKARLK
jgi:ABC-2 type transport system permease protein